MLLLSLHLCALKTQGQDALLHLLVAHNLEPALPRSGGGGLAGGSTAQRTSGGNYAPSPRRKPLFLGTPSSRPIPPSLAPCRPGSGQALQRRIQSSRSQNAPSSLAVSCISSIAAHRHLRVCHVRRAESPGGNVRKTLGVWGELCTSCSARLPLCVWMRSSGAGPRRAR